MTRIQWMKFEWPYLVATVISTLLAIATRNMHNAGGAQPLTVFGGLALMGWLGFIITMFMSDKARLDIVSSVYDKRRRNG